MQFWGYWRFMQIRQRIFNCTDMQIMHFIRDKILKLLTYYTPFCHQSLQSYLISKTVRFYRPTLYLCRNLCDFCLIWWTHTPCPSWVETPATPVLSCELFIGILKRNFFIQLFSSLLISKIFIFIFYLFNSYDAIVEPCFSVIGTLQTLLSTDDDDDDDDDEILVMTLHPLRLVLLDPGAVLGKTFGGAWPPPLNFPSPPLFPTPFPSPPLPLNFPSHPSPPSLPLPAHLSLPPLSFFLIPSFPSLSPFPSPPLRSRPP